MYHCDLLLVLCYHESLLLSSHQARIQTEHPNQDAKKKQLNRLARATGHLNHVKTMMENGEDVSEILIQLSAVISALNGLGKEMINEHIVHCLSHAIENGDTQAIEELKKAINKFI